MRAMKNKSKECLNHFLTVDQAATMRSCTPQGIRKAIKEGRLQAELKGRQYLILKTEFNKFNLEAV
jgi:excisionase family DNA binding protein